MPVGTSTGRLITKLILTGFALGVIMTGVACMVGGTYMTYRERQAEEAQRAPAGCGATAPPQRP